MKRHRREIKSPNGSWVVLPKARPKEETTKTMVSWSFILSRVFQNMDWRLDQNFAPVVTVAVAVVVAVIIVIVGNCYLIDFNSLQQMSKQTRNQNLDQQGGANCRKARWLLTGVCSWKTSALDWLWINAFVQMIRLVCPWLSGSVG